MTSKSTAFGLTDITIYDGKLLCKCGETYVLFQKGQIHLKNKLDDKANHIIMLPYSNMKRLLCKNRLAQRMLRLEPRTAIAIDDNHALLSHLGCIYRIDIRTREIKKEHQFRTGMNNVLYFCKTEGEKAKRFFYGEYWPNSNREGVSIFERDIDGLWNRIYTFPEKTIKHIHNIVFDSQSKAFWITTGDNDKESIIWKANESFTKVIPMYGNGQLSRTCFLIPNKKTILYFTDTPLQKNTMHSYDYSVGNDSVLGFLPGSCIYGVRLNDQTYAFSTAVECNPNKPLMMRLLSNKIADGNMDRNSYIYLGNKNESPIEIGRSRKDKYLIGLFGFGTFQFPDAFEEGFLYCTGQAVKSYDGKTIRIDISSIL